ncbi:MAG: IPT/TIG domain-containing protein [Archangium sp.]|nr:IPT/TIG domain-containing protein [Archangium sp.]
MRIVCCVVFAASVASAQIPLSDVFTWSESGPVVYPSVRLPDGGTTSAPGTTECVRVFDSSESTWANTYLCSPYAVGLSYSAAGPLPSVSCLSLRVGSDPNWADGANYLCVPPATLRVADYFFWATGGPPPVDPTSCIQLTNASEPSGHGWSSVWLCHRDAPTIAPDLLDVTVTNGGSASSATALQLQLRGFFFGAPTTLPVVTVSNGPNSAPCVAELDGGVSTHGASLMRCALGPAPSIDTATSLTVRVSNYGMTGLAASVVPPPVILGLTKPAQAPTAGGWLLTVDGRFFGDTPLVLVNGQGCSVQGGATRTRLQCLVPAGAGTASVVLIAGGRPSNTSSIQYDPPSISSATYSASTNLVTITGFNFAGTGTVLVGGLLCNLGPGSSWSNTQITCTPAAALSGNQAVRVVVGMEEANSTVFIDRCPVDPNKVAPGACGCGVDESADGGCGNVCTTSAQCQSGRVCVDGVCCDGACGGGATDDCVVCSRAAGGPVNGTCVPRSLVGCDDHDACTQQDQCSGGVCTGGLPVSCPPIDQCHTAGVCGAGACSTPALPDGTNCSLGFCAAGVCVPLPCAAMPCFAGVSCINVSGPAPTFFCGVCPAGFVGNGVTCTAIVDGGLADAGLDGGPGVDAGGADAGADAGLVADAGRADAGADAGLVADAGGEDAGLVADAGSTDDAGTDAGFVGGDDAGLVADAGATQDAGAGDAGFVAGADAGGDPGTLPTGCGCSSPGGLSGLLFGAWLLLRSRKRK